MPIFSQPALPGRRQMIVFLRRIVDTDRVNQGHANEEKTHTLYHHFMFNQWSCPRESLKVSEVTVQMLSLTPNQQSPGTACSIVGLMLGIEMFVICWQNDEGGGMVHIKHRSVDVSQQTQVLEPSARHGVVFLQSNRTARFIEAS